MDCEISIILTNCVWKENPIQKKIMLFHCLLFCNSDKSVKLTVIRKNDNDNGDCRNATIDTKKTGLL